MRRRLSARAAEGKAYEEMRVAGHRLDAQVAVVAADDDTPADIQPEAGALADRLGGEERLEDPLLDVGGHARPRVTDIDQKLVTVKRRPDSQRAQPGHGRDRVVDQVRPHLIELTGEARNPGQ